MGWRFVDCRRGEGKVITNETEYGVSAMKGEDQKKREFKLDDPSTLAIKSFGQLQEFPIVSELRSLIESWHISDFHIADARSSVEVGYAEHLSTRGDNVAQVAQYLYKNHPEQFETVLNAMRDRVPGVNGVEAKHTEDGRLVLRFQDGSFQDPFIARYVSDGTIKMFSYLVLLYDPNPHSLLTIEEPENQLYPALLRELVEEFRDYARRGGQVFVSTHSPDFLNGSELDEIRWLVKEGGFTKVAGHRRASSCRPWSMKATCLARSGGKGYSTCPACSGGKTNVAALNTLRAAVPLHRQSRNDVDLQQPASSELRWKSTRRLASISVKTRFMST